jgi:hypothetical protein
MTPEYQTIAALAVVGLATTWLVLRHFAKRKNGGCAGDCGCPSSELKSKLPR